jgi:hypothetical protein
MQHLLVRQGYVAVSHCLLLFLPCCCAQDDDENDNGNGNGSGKKYGSKKYTK